MLSWVAFVLGVVGWIATVSSVVETTVVPRGTKSRITAAVASSVQSTFQYIADRFQQWERRDRVWALSGPVFLMTLLVVWLVLLLAALTLVMLPFAHGDLEEAFLVAGSSLLTLGVAIPNHVVPLGFVFIGAATGLVVVALQIAYLPTLYSAYNRREVQVTILDSLGGSPAWGPEILARFSLIGGLDGMDLLYVRWMEWAADLSESHAAYKSLIYFRSPKPTRSWVIAFLAVLDAAALHLAACPDTAPLSARRLLRVGYRSMQDIAEAVGVPPAPSADEAVSDLTDADIRAAFAHLVAAGMVLEQPEDEAVADFQGWRVNYEVPAYGLAEHIDAVPAMWSGRRRRRGATLAPLRPEHAGLD
ncbi:hypothetical protein [Aquihabitans sp. McL0605]|uniref:hypothetical protein n=1 Tax=Aquihabitans sp. McL0605 TaxID=3415671 RepID=UPI003CF9B929